MDTSIKNNTEPVLWSALSFLLFLSLLKRYLNTRIKKAREGCLMVLLSLSLSLFFPITSHGCIYQKGRQERCMGCSLSIFLCSKDF
jgi:hypothetical protein